MAENLTKKDLANALAETFSIKKKDAADYVNFVFDQTKDVLVKDGVADMSGFGKFSIQERAARQGINPATKEKIEIAASKSPKFKASKALKDALNPEK